MIPVVSLLLVLTLPVMVIRVASVGIVTAMSSLLLSFVDMRGHQSAALLLGVLVAGLVALLAVSSSAWVDRYLCRAISWALRRFTRLDSRDYTRRGRDRGDGSAALRHLKASSQSAVPSSGVGVPQRHAEVIVEESEDPT